MHRLPRIAGSFVLVLALYWAYALVAVPLIEPTAAPRMQDSSDEVDSVATASLERRIRELEGLFTPPCWQLTNPKILESGQMKVLLRDYRNIGDGRIEITACSIIQMPEGASVEDPQQRRRAVVLDAPRGAVLKFDKAIDLRRAEVGRLVAGQLKGEVTIRSQGRSPGPEDDLLIVTSNVELTELEIWTEAHVRFSFGPNSGWGDHMRVRLSQGDPGKKSGLGPNIGGLESFELKRRVHLYLEPRPGKAIVPAAKGQSPIAGAKPADNNLPLEISCDGPFFFEMQHRAASFRDNVVVLRHDYSGGQSDELTGDRLTIYFEPRRDRPAAKPGADGQPALSDLEIRRLEAHGTPVNLVANTQQARASGDRMVYDLLTGEVELESADRAVLTKGNEEIRSVSFKYRPDPSGKLGQLEAKGPGSLRAEMRERVQKQTQPAASQPQTPRPPQQFQAEWGGQLRVRPDEQNQLISLTGGASLTMPQLGQLAARDIHFWVKELAKPGPDGNRFVPDRMRAEHEVKIQSPQLTGAVDEMEVWFVPATGPGQPKAVAGPGPVPTLLVPTSLRLPPEQPAAAADGPALSAPATVPGLPLPASPDARQADPSAVGPPLGSGVGPAPENPVPAASQEILPASPSAAGLPQSYHVEGRLLRARLVMAEPQTEIAELFVIDRVCLRQASGEDRDDKPLLVTGDQIQAIRPSSPTGTLSVTGKPAHFEWHGLGLTGLNINLNRGANRLWVDGPGNMDVPMRQATGGPLAALSGAKPESATAVPGATALLPAAAGTLNIRWHESMNFYGQVAVFQNMVTAETPGRHLETETLEVLFREAVRFDQAQSRQQPDVQELHCLGGVWMESTTSQAGQQATLERAEFKEVRLNVASGDTVASGPGWLARVGRPSAESRGPLRGPPTRMVGLAQPASPAAVDNTLDALLIRFQGQVRGNIQRREMVFYDRIAACFGPVANWDATPDLEHPERLGPRGAVLHCEELAVVEMPNPAGGPPSAELEARRNVVVESQSYTARGQRVAYAQAKDLLILQGDGRTDARLYREPTSADPRPAELVAQRIWFWPTTPNRVYVEKARSLELNQFSNPK